jgi:DNA excision repair protein ERCC-3
LRDEDLHGLDDVGRITDRKVAAKNRLPGLVKRSMTTSKSLAGGDNMAYMEYSRNSGGQFARNPRGNQGSSKEHHSLFKKHLKRK